MSSKTEKIVAVVVCFIMMLLVKLVFPVKQMTTEIKIQYILVSLLMTFVFWFIYVGIRNHYISKTIEKYLLNNDFESCSAFLNTQIKKHKKLKWLQFDHLRFLALAGCYTEFKTKLSSISYDAKDPRILHIIALNQLYNVLSCDEKNSQIIIEYEYINDIQCILSDENAGNYNLLIEKANYLFNSPYNLYKSIAAMVLSKAFLCNGDESTAMLYEKRYKELVPSEEVFLLIENIKTKLFK